MRNKLVVAIIIIGIVSPGAAFSTPLLQENTPIDDPQVLQIIEDMSVEQRVGQLFLVTFDGREMTLDSAIADLVREHYVGGVVLRADNENFSDEESLAEQVLLLTNDLQRLADTTTSFGEEEDFLSSELLFIPLLIGLEQEGDGYPSSQLYSDVTPLPSNMAIGATWNPTHAEAVGGVVGAELSVLGINMLLGPTLDVVESPQPGVPGDPGVLTFGGDPFWVSEMGEAYVRGVHIGSSGRVAVIPRHFPGVGSADRQTAVEVPTVRRSLAQLVQVDLAPFFAVTGQAEDVQSVADGLLTAHIRYLGFQGDNPRLATRPISLDPQALQVLMEQSQIEGWRVEGGLLVSDALGQRGIRRFYDPSEETFANRRIAQEAFLAGNDLLYLDQFGPTPDSDQTDTVINTIEWFIQKYETDPTFLVRVDEAVARIIRKKLDMYGSFTQLRVQRPISGLSTLGQANDVTVDVAGASVTLLSPSLDELPLPPQSGERIVIFTDARTVAQCSSCEASPLVSPAALEDAIVRFYGPLASGLTSAASIDSFSFQELNALLEFGLPVVEEGEPTPEPDPVDSALNSSTWIVFVMLDIDPDIPASDVVKRFLDERADLVSSTNVVVMAMNAPYYLDSTEISKLTAYYALYGNGDAFVDTAARALYQEVLPAGASPVTVRGIEYDILEATSPDQNQIIELYHGTESPDEASASQPVELELKDFLLLNTGIILDHNGNQVPDGTPVEFHLNFVDEGLITTEEATTIAGAAQFNLRIERVGLIVVNAVSEPAQLSGILDVLVSEEGVGITPRQPDVPPTVVVSPAATPDAQGSGNGVIPTPTPIVNGPPPPPPEVALADLLLSLLGLVAISSVAFRVGQRRGGLTNAAMFPALLSLVGGLLFYNYYALNLPGSEQWGEMVAGIFSASLATWIGGLLGFGTALAILRWRN